MLNIKKLTMAKEASDVSLTQKILNYSVYIVLAVLIVYFSFSSPVFLSQSNIRNFFSQIPAVGLLTLAVTMILITGQIDLSVASTLAFSGTLAAWLATQGHHPVVVIGLSLLSGAGWGLVNGFFITKFKLEPFILTLGTGYIIRGLALFATNGINVSGVPNWFFDISNTRIATTGFLSFFSSNTLIFFVLIGVFSFVLNKTRFGRYCFAVGSNKEAARLSGIKTDVHIIKVYIVAGMVAALAGILTMSNLNVGAPSEGVGTDLFALAGAIIGGSKFGGGVGTISGAIAGIFTIQVFQNGLSILGVNTFMQQVVLGIIIVVAVVIDYFRRKN